MADASVVERSRMGPQAATGAASAGESLKISTADLSNQLAKSHRDRQNQLKLQAAGPAGTDTTTDAQER